MISLNLVMDTPPPLTPMSQSIKGETNFETSNYMKCIKEERCTPTLYTIKSKGVKKKRSRKQFM